MNPSSSSVWWSYAASTAIPFTSFSTNDTNVMSNEDEILRKINLTDEDGPSYQTISSSFVNSFHQPFSNNYTVDETESKCYNELFQGYSTSLLTFASAICIIFILLGVPGNLITIIALARCKKVRNATAVFIINLSLSDLLFCCFNLPLASSTYWQRAWCHGELLCRLFPLMRYGLLAVSLFTILAITINRYVMIGHPRIYPRIYRHRYLGIMVASTWVCAFGTLIPTWRGVWGQFGMDKDIGSCTILKDKNGTNPKEFLFTMAFIVPCISIIVCYARIFYIVRKTALRSHEPILTSQSIRLISGKAQRSNTQDDTNHSDRQLLEKSSRTSKDENSENSSSISNSSGYPQQPFHQIVLISTGSSISTPTTTTTTEVGNQLSMSQHSNKQQNRLNKSSLSKLNEDEIKFLDSSKGNDFPTLKIPTVNKLKSKDPNLLNTPGMKLLNGGNTSMNQKSSVNEIDSAVEESTSSSDNNQVFHITPSTDTSNQILSVQVEPSSSSGVDLPLDQESPPRRRIFKKSLKASINRMTKRQCRKASTINTSGASILYPGRMTQKDRRLLKMILVIFLSFVVCYLPITITKIWRNVTEFHFFNIMGYLLIYLTTCINPIIYVVMSSEYRQAYWNLLLCRTVTNNRQQQQQQQQQQHHQQQPNNNGGIIKNESRPKLLSQKT